MNKAENRIEEIENRLAQLEEKLTQEDVYTDVDQLLKINAEKESLDKELLHWMQLWESFSFMLICVACRNGAFSVKMALPLINKSITKGGNDHVQ